MIRLNKILVPTDFSEHSDAALRYAVELATKFGAELHIFHAIEPVPVTVGLHFGGDIDVGLAEAADEQLDKLQVELDDLPVLRAKAHGHPMVEIIRYAKENNIDLIVLGTHGRGAIAHMLLGSVAEKVVRKAPCPVFAVRDKQHEFVMP